MTMFQPPIDANDLEPLVALYQKKLGAEALDYLESRGVHESTIAHFSLGYEEYRIGFSVQQTAGHLAGRIIFPIRNVHGETLDLIGRAVEDRDPKYKPLLGIAPLLFNEQVLAEEDADDVVLAGGMFDVLSLQQASLPAVAVPDCYSFHKDQAPLFQGKRVFICYGNDDAGRRESERIAHLLEDAAEGVFIVTLPEGIKDINDLFVRAENATDVFLSLIERAVQSKKTSGITPDAQYLTTYNEEFLKRHRGQTTGIPTGLAELDDLLLGGFRPGLTVIRGPVGVGKTSLIRQFADHAAGLGCPVAFFTWQASSFELWANSLSRMLDVSVRDILLGNVDPDAIKVGNERYQEFAEHMWTLEAAVDNTSEDILDTVQRIAQTIGKMPVVFLDYLQRIPYSKDETMLPTPERAAHVAYELYQIAQQLNCPLIVTAMEEREGGTLLFQALEATADVLINLTAREEAELGRAKRVLEVQKNRNGHRGALPLWFEDEAALFQSASAYGRKTSENGADVISG